MFKNILEETCPQCRHISRKYKISFSGLHARLARIVFDYCITNDVYIITKKEIAPFLSHTDYGNFYMLQRFGLIYYAKDGNGKRIKGTWGVPVRRLWKFLNNEFQVAEYFWRDKDESTNQMAENRIFLREVPKFEKWIDSTTMLPTFLEFERQWGVEDGGEDDYQ